MRIDIKYNKAYRAFPDGKASATCDSVLKKIQYGKDIVEYISQLLQLEYIRLAVLNGLFPKEFLNNLYIWIENEEIPICIADGGYYTKNGDVFILDTEQDLIIDKIIDILYGDK